MTGHLSPPATIDPVALSGEDLAAYLRRIGYRGDASPSTGTLAGLQLAHLYAVPFENLDIGLGRLISLRVPDLVDKIVRRRRGGFCYELNGLFGLLLRQLGFHVTMLAATFPAQPGLVVPELDHLTLVVDDPAGGTAWLVDVGAGQGSPASPMPFLPERDHYDPVTAAWYRLQPEGDGLRLLRRNTISPDPGIPDGAWEPEFRLTHQPRTLAEFVAGVEFHQTSPQSLFTRERICSLLTPTGRVTVSGKRLITTIDGHREEREMADEAEVQAVLRDRFGIEGIASEGA